MKSVSQRIKSEINNAAVSGYITSVTSDGVIATMEHHDDRCDLNPVAISQFVMICSQHAALIGKVNELNRVEQKSKPAVEATITIIATYDYKTEELEFQVGAHPYIGDTVIKARADVIQHLVESHISEQKGTNNSSLLQFATLVEVDHADFHISPERLFGRHLAVLGTTGSGKSWTLSKIVEEASNHNSKVMLIDATGEFKSIKEHVRHVTLGTPNRHTSVVNPVCLPYHQLTSEDLCYIFQPNKDIQEAKLHDAIRSLKLAALEPKIALDGLILKAHRDKMSYLKASSKHHDSLEMDVADFDIRLLTSQIHNECVQYSRSMTEPNIWGGFDRYDISRCTSLINRIQSALRSRELAPIFQTQSEASLLEEITHFLENSEHRVLCISLEHLSFSHQIREIAVNAIGRFLMKIARTGYFKTKPLVTILDEAHQFLVSNEDNEEEYKLNSFDFIAREGRKYSLTLCLATQRPRDIPADILSQMGNLVVHRLVNENDRKSVELAASTVDGTVLNRLPNLGCGEACLLGVDFRIPLLIQTKAPKYPPVSSGPDYQTTWK